MHPVYRIGAYTFGGERDLIQDRVWQLGLGADVTVYSKPAVLDAAMGIIRCRFRFFCGCGREAGGQMLIDIAIANVSEEIGWASNKSFAERYCGEMDSERRMFA